MIGPKPKIILLDGGQPQAWADQEVGNAVHQPGGLSITIYKNLPDFTGTLAQEWYELENERKAGLLAGAAAVGLSVVAAVGASLAGLTVGAAAGIVGIGIAGAVLAYRLVANATAGKKPSEIRSHALTALAMAKYDSPSFTLATAELACANSMSEGGKEQYSWYKGETNDQLIALMRAEYGNVQQWIDANAGLLQSWQALRGPPIGAQ